MHERYHRKTKLIPQKKFSVVIYNLENFDINNLS